MKIRTDFVTNSSSSSFVTIVVDECEILDRYLQESYSRENRRKPSKQDSIGDRKVANNEVKSVRELMTALEMHIYMYSIEGMYLDEIDTLSDFLQIITFANPKLDDFVAGNKSEINKTYAKVYWLSQFECEPPELRRTIFQNNSVEKETIELSTIDEDFLADLLNISPEEIFGHFYEQGDAIELFKELTPDQMEKIIEWYKLSDCEELDEDDEDGEMME